MPYTQQGQSTRQAGFTLVEMGVVVVIIAVIVAVTLTAQNLLRQARIMSILSDMEYYQTQVEAFKAKYNELPGDMVDAFRYFGSACGTDNDVNSVATGCNGDGDEQIEVGGTGDEAWNVWLHLQLAGMIQGEFSGDDAGAIDYIAGVNSPGTSLKGVGVHLRYDFIHDVGNTNNYFFVGVPDSSNWRGFGGGGFTSVESYSIDLKVDDGLADEGKFYGENGFGTNGCIDISTKIYTMDDVDRECVLVFTLRD